MVRRKVYEIVKNRPYADFWYKGYHSHHVHRGVLVIEETDTQITGYEVLCGTEKRSLSEAPIRSYSKRSIARRKNLRADNPRRRDVSVRRLNETTLKRKSLRDFVEASL